MTRARACVALSCLLLAAAAHEHGGEKVRLEIQPIGTIDVHLMPANAPHVCAVIHALAASGTKGRVHRAEPAPAAGNGPPYGLVQATLEDGGRLSTLQKASSGTPIMRGSVVLVDGTSDIFVSLSSHPGWEATLTAFGFVEPPGMAVVEAISRRKVHPIISTAVNMMELDDPLPLTLKGVPPHQVVGGHHDERLRRQAGHQGAAPPPVVGAPPRRRRTDPSEPVLVDIALGNLVGGTNGSVVLAVHPAWAPRGARRFLELVDRGFYDGHRFFRAVPEFVAQWGLHPDPVEIKKAAKYAHGIWDDPLLPDVKNTRGRAVFAAAGKNTRTTQCFFNLVDNPHLDSPKYSFAPFGEVVEGMDDVRRIYTGYGESVDQGMIHRRPDSAVVARYPKLSRIVTARRRALAANTTAAPAPGANIRGSSHQPEPVPAEAPSAALSYTEVVVLLTAALTVVLACSHFGRAWVWRVVGHRGGSDAKFL